MRFSRGELVDLAAAWLALGVAFTLFLNRPVVFAALARPAPAELAALAAAGSRSLATVGIGFLLHELAHKVVAVRFGQVAWFRADYGMLALAVAAGLAGFLFAAPGAVHHRGTITARENGLIALAGPVTNLALAAAFAPLVTLPGFLGSVGGLGVTVNVLLAGFNLLPVGPLDGRKVAAWSLPVFAAVFLPTLLVGLWLLVA